MNKGGEEVRTRKERGRGSRERGGKGRKGRKGRKVEGELLEDKTPSTIDNGTGGVDGDDRVMNLITEEARGDLFEGSASNVA